MEHLDYFIAIAEEQNLSRAAKRLYISQPALTRFVNGLEEEYGVKLFDRSKSPITLTAAGQIFLQEKLKIDNKEQSLRRRLSEMSTGDIHISIGTGHSRFYRISPEIFSRLVEKYPNLRISVKCAGERLLPDMLSKQQVDFIFGVFDPVDGMEVEWRYATVEKVCLMVPLSFGLLPDSIDPKDTFYEPYMLRPEQLNGLPVIEPHSSLGSSINYQLMMNQYSIRPGRVISAESAYLVRKLVNQGLGFSTCSYARMEDMQDDDGNLVSAVFNLPGLPVRRTSMIAYRKDHPHVELLRDAADFMEQSIMASKPPVTYWKNFSP